MERYPSSLYISNLRGTQNRSQGEVLEFLIDSLMAAGESLVEVIRNRSRAMTAEELSELLGLSRKHVYKLAKARRMPSYRLGGAIRFDPGAVATWLESRSVG